MRLRVWLLITTLTAGLVVLVTISAINYFFEKWTTQEVVAQFAVTYMQNGGREACEKSAATWSAGTQPDGPPRDMGPEGHPDGHPDDRMQPPDSPGGMPDSPPDRNRGHGFAGSERIPFHRQLFAYDRNLNSANPNAPAIDSVFKEKIKSSRSVAERTVSGRSLRPHHPPHRHEHPDEPDRGPPPPDSRSMKRTPDDGGHRNVTIHEMMIPMPWRTGPCTNILIRFDNSGPGAPGRTLSGRLSDRLRDIFPPTLIDRLSPSMDLWMVPVFFMLITVLMAAGPVVRRIRLLTRQVRASASDQYRTPITVKGRDEIGELATAFEDARSEIRSQIAAQEIREQNLRNFVENTTHDISIPLTVLQGRLAEMATRPEDCDPGLVGAAMNETNYLASLIYNLSVASKLETGQPAMLQEPVDLNEVVVRCARRHRPIARQRQVGLDHAVPETPLMTTGDVTFIEQAVSNVIFNAIRHNHADGHVAVILELVGREPGQAIGGDSFRISVIDDGPGIPEDQMSRLVERYYRCGKERGREAEGQGLGLNIACQLAAMHGWKFELGRSEFGGLRVDFTGPVLPSVELAAD